MNILKTITKTRNFMDEMIAKQLSRHRLNIEKKIKQCEDDMAKLQAEYAQAVEDEMEYSAGAFPEEWKEV